ncbi:MULTISPECIES: MurR/RpiR family transcriptional regulator [Lacticaseibacillus]|uniref:MurR/RpiR family transcriptional regulator n=3 Tax=Lacticaseibacillus TaxID=2759736 RepID=A0ABZ0BXU4_LACCA|nr:MULTISPECIES: MurR/RpiR family transcriptional regulator [Lacticaseibacillus]WLV81159.1 MurR/RpiR family transcriptional regulator [Lacticaseibacillus sp. NCIMB 15473]WNX25119.1 MurR/RpiR family transcriptional regulator [Lacticaseibacillus casei]WNX27890.1 MurR/RpiR family transcriptional regulator [Lacticaseibacillus casei]
MVIVTSYISKNQAINFKEILMDTFDNRISQIYPTLGEASQHVADYFRHNYAAVAGFSLRDLSKKIGVSTATISRFGRQLGFASFDQLKLALLKEIDAQTEGDVTSDDNSLASARKTINANISALEGTMSFLTQEQIDRSVDLLLKANKVAIFGLGSSNVLAQAAYHTFLRLPLNLIVDADYHMQLMDANKLTKSDVAIVISHTGNDTDILALVDLLTAHHIPTIAITSYATSPLAKRVKNVFFSISEDTRYRSDALISMTSQFAIFDVLFTELVRRLGKKSDKTISLVHQAVARKHR